MRHIAAVFCLVPTLMVTSTLFAERRQQPAPAFRAGIDLLTVEATVLDRDGLPVRDLGPGEFAVTLDGRPRKIVFADFHGARTREAPGSATVADPPMRATTARVDGRIVVFVVDRDSLASGNELALLETATTVLDSLGSGDAVGLLGVPVGSVELTRDHDRVRAAVPMMTGTRPRQGMYRDPVRLRLNGLGCPRSGVMSC